MLYVGTGDAREPSSSQDMDNPSGKLLRLTPEGEVPADNPWKDRDTLYLTDHGPSGDTLRRGHDVANANGTNQSHTLISGEQIHWGSWSALDATTGDIVWQKAAPLQSSPVGPVTVANGVVYAGTMDPAGHMYALDARSGSILWSFASGGSINSGAAVVDGTVFWGTGYVRTGGTAGRKLYALSREYRE